MPRARLRRGLRAGSPTASRKSCLYWSLLGSRLLPLFQPESWSSARVRRAACSTAQHSAAQRGVYAGPASGASGGRRRKHSGRRRRLHQRLAPALCLAADPAVLPHRAASTDSVAARSAAELSRGVSRGAGEEAAHGSRRAARCASGAHPRCPARGARTRRGRCPWAGRAPWPGRQGTCSPGTAGSQGHPPAKAAARNEGRIKAGTLPHLPGLARRRHRGPEHSHTCECGAVAEQKRQESRIYSRARLPHHARQAVREVAGVAHVGVAAEPVQRAVAELRRVGARHLRARRRARITAATIQHVGKRRRAALHRRADARGSAEQWAAASADGWREGGWRGG